MANVKISQLPTSGPLASTDVFPIVQGVATSKAAVSALDGRYFRKAQNEAPGTELLYSQVTSQVSVTATSIATSQTVIPATPTTFDGSLILLELYLSFAAVPASQTFVCNLFDGASEVCFFGQIAVTGPLYAARRFSPTAGSHSYNIRSWVTAGTATWAPGAGTPGQQPPAFLRITKV